MLLTTSRGIWRQRRTLDRFFAPLTLTRHDTAKLHAIVGWGMKPNTEQARQLAEAKGLPFWQLEDGFIGYIGHPARGATRLSLIVDDVGIYYDATKPSQLEHWLSDIGWWSEDWHHRAAAVRETLITQGITKYNCYDDNRLPPEVAAKLDMSRSRVLLVDQTKGDQSVRLGLADERSFTDMIAAARSENPGAQLLVRTHPDVLLGKKQGYLTAMAGDDVVFLAESMNPFAIMSVVDKVYTVTSQLGFEALLCGKPVACFGAPFYAGWGLTDDRVTVARRGKQRTLEQLLAAAYLRYCRYIDPITEKPCELEELLDLVLVQRSPLPKVEQVISVGFSLWKRSFVKNFMRRYAKRVIFVKSIDDIDKKTLSNSHNTAVLIWGRKFENKLENMSLPVWRMEDGFLRSVGLGSDLRRPGSLVVDNYGMYYDPRTPSGIERYLSEHQFDEQELALGESLLSHFKANSLSKYNVGSSKELSWRVQANGRKIILVPGQVDDDASIQLGSPFIKGNAELLQSVRRANPDSFIVFKPHPDVVSGNRSGNVPEEVLNYCVDLVETQANINSCLEACDSVHTLTSLTGLEALVREKNVTVWGQPFYAGWGLTRDMHPLNRRGRNLPLPAIIYATYNWYPTYIDWPTGLFSTPLRMAWRLTQERKNFQEPKSIIGRWLHRKIRKVLFLWEAIYG